MRNEENPNTSQKMSTKTKIRKQTLKRVSKSTFRKKEMI